MILNVFYFGIYLEIRILSSLVRSCMQEFGFQALDFAHLCPNQDARDRTLAVFEKHLQNSGFVSFLSLIFFWGGGGLERRNISIIS